MAEHVGINASELAPSGKVKARTAPSITISATGPNGTVNYIGAIKKIDRKISRNMIRRRELDSPTPGISIEIVPGAVATFEITIDRVMLNKKNMLEAFGFYGIEDLIHQNIPIDIIETRHMNDSDSGGKDTQQIITYRGCYFRDNPVSLDIDSDWIMIQSASLEVTTADVFPTTSLG